MAENGENRHSSSDDAIKRLVEESNRCVACGLCLPHCPTYRLLQSEADSPRGRIAMINGVATNHIPLNGKFIQHLDRCLTCRACESVCPNKVAYGRLVDEARQMILESEVPQEQRLCAGKHQSWFFSKLLTDWVTRPTRLEKLRVLMYLLQKSGLIGLLRKFNYLKQGAMNGLLMQLPPVVFPCTKAKKRLINHSWQPFYPATGKEKGKVGLFLGCIARITDAETLNAAIFVLNRVGYSVCIPATQTCCGALYQHAGNLEKAAQLMQQNRLAFAGLGVQAVITTASGCGVQLTEFDRRDLADNGLNGESGSFRVVDISKFLSDAADWDTMVFEPLSKKIAVHDPCSLRHVLQDQIYPYQLLNYIPDAQVVFLAGNDQCCGAAGTYFIEQPVLANRLLDDKIKAIIQSGAQLLVTSNVGCAMHIAGRLRETGSEVEVLHPVTLLARRMGMR